MAIIYKKYGETLKKLRKQRGFKLADFKHLGVSPAALCKFERGISLLKFDKLILVLEELSVTLSEYENFLNNYCLDVHEFLIQEIIEIMISNKLDKLPNAYEQALNLKEKYLALAIKSKYSELSLEEQETLIDYFEQINLWRYTDLYTLYLSLDWLKISQISFFIEDFLLTHSNVLNSVKHRERVTHIVCHASIIFISKNQTKLSQNLLKHLLDKDYEHTMFTKNAVNFVTGSWEIKFGEKEKGIELINKSFHFFDLLGYTEVSNYYKRLYKKYLNQTFELNNIKKKC